MITNDANVVQTCPPIGACGVITPSKVVTPGMTVADVLAECIDKQLPGLPFYNEQGEMSGRISLKHIFSMHCIPPNIHKHAHLLGDFLEHIEVPILSLQELNDLPVDNFVIPVDMTITSGSPLVKALALIEQLQSSYIFVVDGDSYQGAVTMLNLARYALNHRIPDS